LIISIRYFMTTPSFDERYPAMLIMKLRSDVRNECIHFNFYIADPMRLVPHGWKSGSEDHGIQDAASQMPSKRDSNQLSQHKCCTFSLFSCTFYVSSVTFQPCLIEFRR